MKKILLLFIISTVFFSCETKTVEAETKKVEIMMGFDYAGEKI